MQKGSKFIKDISGHKTRYLTVKSFNCTRNRRSYWNCICACGQECIIPRKTIMESPNISCGCVPVINHGPYYRSWEECVSYKKSCLLNNSHWEGECLIWDGCTDISGKAKTSFLKTSILVIDFIWFVENLTNLKEGSLYTECGNKLCINKNHIRRGDGNRTTPINRLFEIYKDKRKQESIKGAYQETL